MNIVKLLNITADKNTVIYQYTVLGEWTKYFGRYRSSYITYPDDISSVPESILVIPFIGNILPLAWLCHAKIMVDAIDQNFYDHIPQIKEGYEQMYPMMTWGRNQIEATIVNNLNHKKENPEVACFFSGGVDAFTTMFRHIKERPDLITIWGADVKLSDQNGWNAVRTHVESCARDFGLKFVPIKSDFRSVLSEPKLQVLASEAGDDWWHGFQHGIAIISHAAPLAYLKGWSTVYIASSFSEKMKGTYTCASDPTIDNHIHFCDCQTFHDGYELDRQEKVQYILSCVKSLGKKIEMRVCWVATGGGNCCHCEKCYRTILELVSEGADPNDYGFHWDRMSINKCRKDMRYRIIRPQFSIDQYYPVIQRRMIHNRNKIRDYDRYQWLITMDFSNFNGALIKRIQQTIFVRGMRRLLGCLHRRPECV